MPQPERSWYMFLRETAPGAFLVAAVLCIVCSVLVAGAAVILKPAQEANKLVFKQKNALMAAGLVEGDASPDAVKKVFADSVEKQLVDISTGEVVTADDVKFKIDDYDPSQAAKDPKLGEPVSPPAALPGIQKREPYTFVYEITKDGKPDGFIFPIYGKGLWSTLRGYLAIEADGQTVRGITFYEHAETPGLGGEVDNPGWKALWDDKKVYGEDGKVELGVVKGQGSDEYSVDGLSGATITSRGVDNMVKYWLGPEGFGKYIEKHRATSPGA
ncbi:Na(+)-translocating NADH-quinone reductase subunit C [Botrimarina colliarenosi]|uniref:Na(+)-translocating NADH-quinone reductase subunit C n=1 Tax=Botrimarina colliarenosi TaxID=2528001 RepID=A0A5C6AF94_9BACT|nr:Na(+)-translocating NADH-quinone reductase subunit C [Botrimarina colliarenosi]TWT98100.1 Na(+)-translocating NADH-quinone reductase subunit C [Botrimarina colliarenosi]